MFRDPNTRLKAALLGGLCCAMLAGALVVPELDAAFVEAAVTRFGPVAIVLFVALGIVVSPIPSGVIAMGAGALYGAMWGGALTILGAGLGASCAFALSRYLGRTELAASRSRIAQYLTRERSQRSLMMVIFLTRLIPFISFDAVSYVAGLTPLAFWRFLVATVSGTAPVCIAFAAAGSTAAAGTHGTALIVVACCITLIAPALALLGRLWRSTGMPGRSQAALHSAARIQPRPAGFGALKRLTERDCTRRLGREDVSTHEIQARVLRDGRSAFGQFCDSARSDTEAD